MSRHLGTAGLLLFLGACACGCRPVSPEMTACGAIEDPAVKADCQFQVALPHVSDPAALERDMRGVRDDSSRDLLLLRLMVAVPQSAPDLCQRVRTPEARGKCEHLVDRPHLTQPRPR